MRKDYTYSIAAVDFDHWLNDTESIYRKFTYPAIHLATKNDGKLTAQCMILIYSAAIEAYSLMSQNGGSVDALTPEDIEAVLQNYRDYIVDCAWDESN